MHERINMAESFETLPVLVNRLRELRTAITSNIKDDKKMVAHFLVWHMTFLRGFMGDLCSGMSTLTVIRCPQRYREIMVQSYAVYEGHCPKQIDLSDTKKNVSKQLELINDEAIFLRSDTIYSANEQRAIENTKKILSIYHDGLDGENGQAILPIMLVEVALPMILEKEECLLLDISPDDFDGDQIWRETRIDNSSYVDDVTTFIAENQDIIQNQIRATVSISECEESDYKRYLDCVSVIIAYFLAGENYGKSFENYVTAFNAVIAELDRDTQNSLENGDFLDFFQFFIKEKLLKKPAYNRKCLPTFEVLDEKEAVFCDREFFFFKREDLKNACIGELANVPFCRILKEMDRRGFLKEHARGEHNFSSVICLISVEGKTHPGRFIGIRREFFDTEKGGDSA